MYIDCNLYEIRKRGVETLRFKVEKGIIDRDSINSSVKRQLSQWLSIPNRDKSHDLFIAGLLDNRKSKYDGANDEKDKLRFPVVYLSTVDEQFVGEFERLQAKTPHLTEKYRLGVEVLCRDFGSEIFLQYPQLLQKLLTTVDDDGDDSELIDCIETISLNLPVDRQETISEDSTCIEMSLSVFFQLIFHRFRNKNSTSSLKFQLYLCRIQQVVNAWCNRGTVHYYEQMLTHNDQQTVEELYRKLQIANNHQSYSEALHQLVIELLKEKVTGLELQRFQSVVVSKFASTVPNSIDDQLLFSQLLEYLSMDIPSDDKLLPVVETILQNYQQYTIALVNNCLLYSSKNALNKDLVPSLTQLLIQLFSTQQSTSIDIQLRINCLQSIELILLQTDCFSSQLVQLLVHMIGCLQEKQFEEFTLQNRFIYQLIIKCLLLLLFNRNNQRSNRLEPLEINGKLIHQLLNDDQPAVQSMGILICAQLSLTNAVEELNLTQLAIGNLLENHHLKESLILLTHSVDQQPIVLDQLIERLPQVYSTCSSPDLRFLFLQLLLRLKSLSREAFSSFLPQEFIKRLSEDSLSAIDTCSLFLLIFDDQDHEIDSSRVVDLFFTNQDHVFSFEIVHIAFFKYFSKLSILEKNFKLIFRVKDPCLESYVKLVELIIVKFSDQVDTILDNYDEFMKKVSIEKFPRLYQELFHQFPEHEQAIIRKQCSKIESKNVDFLILGSVVSPSKHLIKSLLLLSWKDYLIAVQYFIKQNLIDYKVLDQLILYFEHSTEHVLYYLSQIMVLKEEYRDYMTLKKKPFISHLLSLKFLSANKRHILLVCKFINHAGLVHIPLGEKDFLYTLVDRMDESPVLILSTLRHICWFQKEYRLLLLEIPRFFTSLERFTRQNSPQVLDAIVSLLWVIVYDYQKCLAIVRSRCGHLNIKENSGKYGSYLVKLLSNDAR